MIIYNLLSIGQYNKHYLDRYIKFIDMCQKINEKTHLTYKESHHIVPKCIFKEYICFNNNPWNKIDLTARQHYIAHWILWKIYPQNPKIQQAFLLFACWKSNTQKREDYKFNSRAYEILKIEHSNNLSERMKDRIPSERERKLASERMKNRTVSEETKKKHSLTRKTDPRLVQISLDNLPDPMFGKDNPFYGRKHSPEMLKFFSESQKNVPLHIRLGSVERAEEMKRNASIKNTGKRWWNNGKTTAFSHVSPGDGWILGRLNKGNLGKKLKI